MRAIECLRDNDLRSPTPELVPGATRAKAAAGDGYAIVYTLFNSGAVFVPATGVQPKQFEACVTQG